MEPLNTNDAIALVGFLVFVATVLGLFLYFANKTMSN